MVLKSGCVQKPGFFQIWKYTLYVYMYINTVTKDISKEHMACRLYVLLKCNVYNVYRYLNQNNQAVKNSAAPKKARMKEDVKSKVAANKWL